LQPTPAGYAFVAGIFVRQPNIAKRLIYKLMMSVAGKAVITQNRLL
jgi:hypothetical protein